MLKRVQKQNLQNGQVNVLKEMVSLLNRELHYLQKDLIVFKNSLSLIRTGGNMKKCINKKKVKKLIYSVKYEWNPPTLEERIHQLEERVNRLEGYRAGGGGGYT